MRRWPLIVFSALLIASLTIVVALGREVQSDLDALATAENDNVSWLMSQLETELLRLEVAVVEAETETGGSLGTVRNRFDIFYSRAATLSESPIFSFLREDPAAQPALAAVTAFLDRVTPIVDGADAELQAALPVLQAQLQTLRPEVRELALSGIQRFAQQDADRRDALAATLLRLATTLFLLFFVVLLAVVFVMKMFRQGQRFAAENQAVRSRFEAAITSSLDAVLVVDTAGRILDYNGAAEEVFGYSHREALGADMADLIVPEHLRPLHRKGMARFLETGEQKVIGAGRVRLEGLRKSQETFPVELSISLAETEGETVFVSYLRDITEELEAEEALRAARDQAQESEKAKSDLLTVMSHEMRTPLNGILGSIELIDQGNLSDRQKRHLKSITVSGELLLSHVTDVLDFSRLSAGNALQNQDVFVLSDVVNEAATSLSANANARDNKVRVEFLSGDPGWVVGYKTALQQCLVNLLGNAIKFTQNGSVTVEVERLQSDNVVEFRVSDTGVGIAPDYLEVIFEEFVMIDTAFARESSGTGLGLAITKRLVEAMGGEISAESIEGEGSLFTMRIPLPVAQSDHASNRDAANVAGTEIPAGKTALVVDDNEINRMILTDMLHDLGLQVEEAADGYTALDLLAKRPFDVLLLDISMPGIDGIETLNRFRALDVDWCALPAIAVTAHAAKEDHEAILKASFQDLLVKPVPLSRVRTAVAAALSPAGPGRATSEPEQAEIDFKTRFGEEKYHSALADLTDELSTLLVELEQSQTLATEQLQTAHKLSGSAAILGKSNLWQNLQNVQNCPENSWPEQRDQLLAALREEMDVINL